MSTVSVSALPLGVAKEGKLKENRFQMCGKEGSRYPFFFLYAILQFSWVEQSEPFPPFRGSGILAVGDELNQLHQNQKRILP